MIRHKKYVLITVIVIGLVACGVWFFVLKPASNNPQGEQAALESGADKPYGELTSTEREARAKQETGYTMQELQNKTLDDKFLPDGDKAYSTAQLLASAGNYKKSLDAYKIAEPKNSSQDFYNQYVEAAILAEDQALATELMKKQLALLTTEPVKDEIAIARLNDMIADREGNL